LPRFLLIEKARARACLLCVCVRTNAKEYDDAREKGREKKGQRRKDGRGG